MNGRALLNLVLILTMAMSGVAAQAFIESVPGTSKIESDCILSVHMECSVIGDGMSESEDCETFALPMLAVDSCKQTPITATMLYNGGNCFQTSVDEDVPFSCQDGAIFSPPTAEGDESYIVVTDAQGKGILYHEGWVQVGSEYVLSASDGSIMQYGFHIQIYDDSKNGNLLQNAVYSSRLCSSDREVLQLFGASQIISYTNKDQGTVSPIDSFSYETILHVSISSLKSQGTVSLRTFSLLTSFAGQLTLDHLVKNDKLVPGGTLTIAFPIEIDFAEDRMNSVLAQVAAAIQNENGSRTLCKGSVIAKFHTGGLQVGRS